MVLMWFEEDWYMIYKKEVKVDPAHSADVQARMGTKGD